jgi:hypothetical protein
MIFGCLNRFQTQVYCLDILGSTIPSPKFSVNGLGFADESFPLPHYLHLFPTFFDGLPCHISWPLVFGSCFSYGRKKAGDAYYITKLCSEFLDDNEAHVHLFV